MDQVTPKLQQAMDAQSGLRDRALVLLSRLQPRSLAELITLLGCTRAELMGVMGELKGRELVTFSRPAEANGVHWYATAKGRSLGNELFDRVDLSAPATVLEPAVRPALEDVTRPRKSLAGRRRVVLSEREQPGERSFSFD